MFLIEKRLSDEQLGTRKSRNSRDGISRMRARTGTIFCISGVWQDYTHLAAHPKNMPSEEQNEQMSKMHGIFLMLAGQNACGTCTSTNFYYQAVVQGKLG